MTDSLRLMVGYDRTDERKKERKKENEKKIKNDRKKESILSPTALQSGRFRYYNCDLYKRFRILPSASKERKKEWQKERINPNTYRIAKRSLQKLISLRFI